MKKIELPPDIFDGLPCRDCGNATLTLEYRDETVMNAKPLGTWSLAGAQMKTSAVSELVSWPWCVCTTCGGESKGKY